MSLLDEAIAAHGGQASFDAAAVLRFDVRVGGLAWGRRGLDAPFDLRGEMDAHRPAVRFDGLPVVDLAKRPPFGKRWSVQEQSWFCSYALWNYLTTPWLLARCDATELPRRRLRVRFPPEIPTHSPVQTFHFDRAARLVRLDYTALAIGRWAATSHDCREHAWFDGLLVPTRRRARPRGLPGPTLVAIEVRSVAIGPPGSIRGRSGGDRARGSDR